MAFSDNFIIIVILFIIICATDFFDGRLARKLMSNTKFGAVFDVIADLFFISTTYIVLIIRNLIPIWLLAIVLLKFCEFCITSLLARKTGKCQNSIFLFDILGKVVILLFYALPIPIILLEYYIPELPKSIINIIGYILTMMACMSSFYRIKMCFEPVHFQGNYDIVD